MKRTGMLMAAIALLMIPVISQAETFGFYNITNNGNSDVGGQLSVNVTDAGSGKISFYFSNAGPINSSITDIYFDDGTLLGIATINPGPGTAFTAPATPGNLPGGASIVPAFVTNTPVGEYFSADSNSGPPGVKANGINPVEHLEIIFNLINGQTFANTIAALNDGSLRIGLHVQAIGTTKGSDSYVNRVPEAGTLLLLGTGLLGLAGFGARRKFRK